ncbi:hypothetical protein [Acinetobacter johnsonii]
MIMQINTSVVTLLTQSISEQGGVLLGLFRFEFMSWWRVSRD